MFNVSALLLNDALKMCCYRSRLVSSCCFQDTDISQRSVATHLRCCAIFSNNIITNFLLILTVKNLKIGQYLTKLQSVQKCANFLYTNGG